MRALNRSRSIVIGVILVIAVLALTILGTVQPLEAAGPPNAVETEELNVDENGFIAVHEQGVADVNIVGGDSTVSIDDTDPVEVNVSSMPTVDLDTATDEVLADIKDLLQQVVDQETSRVVVDQFRRKTLNMTSGQQKTFTFDPILATHLFIGSDGDEIQVLINNIGGTRAFIGSTDETFPVAFSVPFSYPVRISAVSVSCQNEVFDCRTDIAVFGLTVDE